VKKNLLALTLALAGTAATAATTTSSVRIVDQNFVANCTYVTSITESRHSGMLFAGSGLKKAQEKVLASAGRAGATHVVWVSLNAGGAIQTATASAYRCQN